MKRFFYFVLLLIFLTACEKDQFNSEKHSDARKDFILAGETSTDVYYHDIVPDWEKHGFGLINDSVNIDINNDNKVDVCIRYTTFLSSSEYDQQTTVDCYNGASVSLTPKNLNDTIGVSSAWTSSTAILCYTKIDLATNDTTFIGQWHGVNNKYIGVKIRKGNRLTFGWIRMSLLVPPSIVYVQQIIVKDFGCRINY